MYKYTEKFVADLLFNENSIRIGTLEGFRKMEAKSGISDPLEGSFIDNFYAEFFNEKDYASSLNLRNNIESMIRTIPGSSTQVIGSNNRVITTWKSPNYLIFCSAHTKSLNVSKQFEGADTCYHIQKPHVFFQLITQALEKELNHAVNFLGIHKVDYDEYERQRSDIHSVPIRPAIAKTKEFMDQCELRAIWEVPEKYITKLHYDLKVHDLCKTCRLVDL